MSAARAAIAPLAAADRPRWEVLARGYKAFYRTEVADGEYDKAWARLLDGSEVHGLGAKVEGRLVGIAHYLFHTSVWAPRVCYLQDLKIDTGSNGG